MYFQKLDLLAHWKTKKGPTVLKAFLNVLKESGRSRIYKQSIQIKFEEAEHTPLMKTRRA